MFQIDCIFWGISKKLNRGLILFIHSDIKMSLIELLQKMDEIKVLFEKVQSETVKLEESQIPTLQKIFDYLKPIMRFIDKKIPLSMNETNSSYGKKTTYEYSGEKGIVILGELLHDFTGDYPNENNHWEYSGSKYYLTRNLKIILLEYDGNGSAWEGQSSSWNTTIQELTVEQMLINSGESENFDLILNNIRDQLHRAVKENENKYAQLKNQIEKMNCINEILKDPEEGKKDE